MGQHYEASHLVTAVWQGDRVMITKNDIRRRNFLSWYFLSWYRLGGWE